MARPIVAARPRGRQGPRRHGPRQGAPAPAAVEVVHRIPFIEGAEEHMELIDDRSTLMDANAHTVTVDIPAYGFLRRVYLRVIGTGGVIGTGTLSGDGPFTALQQAMVLDTKGNAFFGPADGFPFSRIAKYGGYEFSSDPATKFGFTNTINPVFALNIPVEITAWDGYGSLGNLSGTNPLRLKYTVSPSSAFLATVGTATPPTIRVQAFLEAWSEPPERDQFGRAIDRRPPAYGTTQFWRVQTKAINVGLNVVRLDNVGNLLRNIIVITRDATGVRADTVMPDPFDVTWDAHQLSAQEPQAHRKDYMQEKFGLAPETGVFVFSNTWDNSGHPGMENRHLWLPTVSTSRLEIRGTAAAAGTMEVWTNEVQPVPGNVGTPMPLEG